MAPTSTALTTKVESGSPYQLNPAQVLKASTALLKHIQSSQKDLSTSMSKQDLLSADEDAEDTSSPIWLTLSTKNHIVSKKSLKPSKISTPHPLLTSPTSTICLITADPQRTYKDLVASPSFPASLASRITRVVGIKKLKAKHSQYEAQRKLKAEHDIFLADDRIIVGLPKVLGKTLYKGTSKRPIPVTLTAPAPRTEGKRLSRSKSSSDNNTQQQPATALAIAKEIEKALSGTSVYLSPSSSTAVKIGYASWDAQRLAENIEAVTNALIEKHVPQKWRGVKGVHVKGERSAALPIWLADELWVDEGDVLGVEEAKEIAKANVGKKRKAISADEVVEEENKDGKKKKQKVMKEGNDDKLDQEIALRKLTLKKQKEEAAKDVVDEVPKASKKSSKKGKAVVV